MSSAWFTEHAHQKFLFDWAHLQRGAMPALRMMFAVPNGGKRDPITAAMLRSEGVKPGVPDICLPVARGCWHGMFIEMKAPAYPLYKKAAGRTSVEQEQWLEDLHAEGYFCRVCWGWEDARDAILGYLASSDE